MIREKELVDPIYGAYILLLVGTLDDLRTYKKQDGFTDCIATELLSGEVDRYRGRFTIIERGSDGARVNVIFVKSDVAYPDNFIVAAHEALHATCQVLRDKGMELSQGSEEAYTYYQSWILEHLVELLLEQKKKRRTRRRLKKRK